MRITNNASLNPGNITMMAIVKIGGFNTGTCHANEIIGKGSPDNIIYAFDSTESKIYVNGVLKSSLTKGGTFTANNHDLLIGRHDDATYPYWFTGVIDEVRIYNRALPIGAINTLGTLKN